MSLTHYIENTKIHCPLPEPNDDIQNTYNRLAEIWALSEPTLALVYGLKTSQDIIIHIIRNYNDTTKITSEWYIQPNILIHESLEYIFRTGTNNIKINDIIVMKEFCTDSILSKEPLFDYRKFPNFTWHCYNVLDYVLQVFVTIH